MHQAVILHHSHYHRGTWFQDKTPGDPTCNQPFCLPLASAPEDSIPLPTWLSPLPFFSAAWLQALVLNGTVAKMQIDHSAELVLPAGRLPAENGMVVGATPTQERSQAVPSPADQSQKEQSRAVGKPHGESPQDQFIRSAPEAPAEWLSDPCLDNLSSGEVACHGFSLFSVWEAGNIIHRSSPVFLPLFPSDHVGNIWEWSPYCLCLGIP